MFRKRLIPGLFLLLLCSLPLVSRSAHGFAGPIHHIPKKDLRQQVTDMEQQWREATLNGDVPAMDKLLSEDYVGISWTGQVNTKTSQLDRLRNKTLVISRMELSDVKVKVVGQVAIVTSRAELEGTNDGVPLKGSFIYTRIYQRLPSGVWKITNFESTRVPVNGRGGRRRDDAAAVTPSTR